jgi:hypothetical protein
VKSYEAIFAREALDALLRLPRRQRQAILILAETIAADPQKPPHLSFSLSTGESLAGYVTGRWIVWGFPDHAAREWRVVKLEMVR